MELNSKNRKVLIQLVGILLLGGATLASYQNCATYEVADIKGNPALGIPEDGPSAQPNPAAKALPEGPLVSEAPTDDKAMPASGGDPHGGDDSASQN